MSRSVLALTVGRFGLFLLCALLVRVVSVALDRPLGGLPLLLVALLVSSPLGILLFAQQRRALAEQLMARREEKARVEAERRARIENEP